MNIKMLAVVCSVLLVTACGGDDKKKPAPVVVSSKAASIAASSKPASVAASSKPASVAASSMGAASSTAPNKVLKLTVTKAGGATYQPQLVQALPEGTVPVSGGKMYKLSLKIKANKDVLAKDFKLSLGDEAGMDHDYAEVSKTTADLTTKWQLIESMVFTSEKAMNDVTTNDSFQLDIGGTADLIVWVDDIKMVEQGGTGANVLSHSDANELGDDADAYKWKGDNAAADITIEVVEDPATIGQ
jgi:hypothetical protein